MSRGKREAVGGGGWQKGGDPFEEGLSTEVKGGKPSRKAKTPKAGKGEKGEKLPWRAWPRWKQVLTVAGSCVAVLAVVAVAAWMMLVRRPDVSRNDRPGVTDNNPNLPQGSENDPEAITGRKEDYYTFLLIGRDTAGGGNTDTLILVSYDVPNQQVNMMSIPRDTAVNVPWSVKKINSVYNAKESSGGGIDGLKNHVAYLTGVMPDFYVIIEWKAVGEVVEAVGGVEFDVPRNMNYDDDFQGLHIHLSKGLQTLNGQQAMNMLRYRNDNGYKAGYNDIGRMNTQRDFLKAMAKKVLQLGNITKIGDFIKIFMDNVETDMKLSDLMWFATQAMGMDVSTMQSSTLPYIDVGTYRKGDYLFPNGEEIVPLVNEQFNPYNREITLSDLQILVRNQDGSCYVTSGELLATGWATPTSSGSSGTAGGGVTTTEPTGVVADPSSGNSDGSGDTGSSGNSGNTGSAGNSGDSGSTGNSGSSGNSGGSDDPAPPENNASGGETQEPPVTGPGDTDPGGAGSGDGEEPGLPEDPSVPEGPGDEDPEPQPGDGESPEDPGDTSPEDPGEPELPPDFLTTESGEEGA